MDTSDIAGTWSGRSTLSTPWMEEKEHPGDSVLVVAPSANGAAARLDYTWVFEGEPQQGTILVVRAGDHCSAGWTDSWHQHNAVMSLDGSVSGCEADGEILAFVQGTYPAGRGPDWGWWITVRIVGDVLHLDMDNVGPAQPAEPAMRATYRRG